MCGTTDIGRPGCRSYQVLAGLSGTDVLPVDQVWIARRSMQHGPAIANQAPHRHRQAKSGTCRDCERPHARHTCLRQSTADQGCVIRHGVVLGIAIDFGGLLNAAVGRRRLCNSSAQSSPGRRLSALAMCLVERVSWHQEGYLVRILISMTCRQR